MRETIRLAAWLGRYAHQSYDQVMRMTLIESKMYAEEVAAIMNEESEQMKVATDID